MKQTAVEWLVEQLDGERHLTEIEINRVIQQAKAMEKEQIMDAYDAGLFDGTMDDVKDRIYKQYYNETFKK